MILRLLALGLLLAVVAAVLWGARAAERVLDEKLPALLSDALGLPVTLEPVGVSLPFFEARTARLVLGDASDPAVVARDVEVKLQRRALLGGEVRLHRVRALELDVKMANWPAGDAPSPQDYRFLEQWLPRTLRLEKGRYLDADGDAYPVERLLWQRRADDGASLSWLEQRVPGPMRLAVDLESLPALLALKGISATVSVTAAESSSPEVELKLSVAPDPQSGYRLDAKLAAAGMQAQITASHSESWRFPARSETNIDLLRPGAVSDLLDKWAQEPPGPSPEQLLLTATPRLELPEHSGRISIDEIRVDDEVILDTEIGFQTSATAIAVPTLRAAGPAADLAGRIALVQQGEGWTVELGGDLNARDAAVGGIARAYLESDWHWRSGRVDISGSGDTFGALLDSLRGDIALEGWLEQPQRTPIIIDASARLEPRDGAFGLEDLSIQLGEARLSGTLALSGRRERTLTGRVHAEKLDLNFLFEDKQTEPVPGVAVPEYLTVLPGVELDGELTIRQFLMPGVQLSDISATLHRGEGRGDLSWDATGVDGGQLRVDLDWQKPGDAPTDVTLRVGLDSLDLQELFRQEGGIVDNRTTGSFQFASRGRGMAELFDAMQGRAGLTLDFRADGDWNRPPRPEERIRVAGHSRLVVEQGRILGVDISDLDIDATEQDLTGNLSMVAGREPWVIAELRSDRLNITQLGDYLPATGARGDSLDPLAVLRRVGPIRASLQAEVLQLDQARLSRVVVEADSGPDRFALARVDFTLQDTEFSSRAALLWRGERARFDASGKLSNLALDDFLTLDRTLARVPVAGSFELQAEGSRLDELIASVNGRVRLTEATTVPPSDSAGRRRLDLAIRRMTDGVEADIKAFAWGESDLEGKLRYRTTSPPMVEADIRGGTLSLLHWEQAAEVTADDPGDAEPDGLLAAAARRSARVVHGVMTAPLRVLSDSGQSQRGQRIFSEKPWDLSVLQRQAWRIEGRLDAVLSKEAEIRNIQFSTTASGGKLNASLQAGVVNGGRAEMELDFDLADPAAPLTLTGSILDVHRTPESSDIPRTAVVSLSSRGHSQAELAANLDGMAYFELGRGPLDYAGFSLLTADLAGSVFSTLIPGIERRPAEMQCGVTLANFKEGVGITPYGYAARTRRANLMGRIEVDLGREQLSMRLDSRSREGLGISISNTFAKSVRVEGPLSNPSIVLNTRSMALRGWAAFMTAGLSVVGEGVLRRALASADPCEDIRNKIREDLCGRDYPVARSPRVCPP